MKVYRFASTENNKYNINKTWTKTYNLAGLKAAIKSSYWVSNNNDYLEVVEYDLKEVKRLTIDEIKQLNNKSNTDKYLELLELVTSKSKLTIEFYDCNTGSVWIDHGSNRIEFNSLDEAIKIVSKY